MKLIFGNRRNSSSTKSQTYRTAQGPWRCREGLLRGPTGGHARAQQATALAQQMRAPLVGKRGVVALSKAASIPFPVLLGAILMCNLNLNGGCSALVPSANLWRPRSPRAHRH